jgi:hypothetical protein
MRSLFACVLAVLATGVSAQGRLPEATRLLDQILFPTSHVETFAGRASFEAREGADAETWLVVTLDTAPADGAADVQFLAQAPQAVRPGKPWRGAAKVEFWHRGLRLIALDERRAWDLVLAGEDPVGASPEDVKRVEALGIVKRPAQAELPLAPERGGRATACAYTCAIGCSGGACSTTCSGVFCAVCSCNESGAPSCACSTGGGGGGWCDEGICHDTP